MESKDEVLKKYTRKGTSGYVFIENSLPVGAVRIITRGDMCKVSALAVLPEYQNKGIAQTALKEIESIHNSCSCWVLDTILQERGSCHLYEKLGYIRTGEPKKLSDTLTLVDYKKKKGNIEIWDAYGANENKLEYSLFRDEPVPDGVYHIVVEVYVFSRNGKVLITQRAKNKTYPLKWENTGGSILKGESPLQGAVRELKEETGITAEEEQLCFAYTEVRHPPIYKCFVALVEGDEQITLQEGETVDYKWLKYDEFLEFIKTDDFVPKIRDSILNNKESINTALNMLIKGNRGIK